MIYVCCNMSSIQLTTDYSFAPLSFSVLSVAAWKILGAREIEYIFRLPKDWPQYRFISRPVYKFVASKTNNVFATAVSFFVTDLLVHQAIPQILFFGLHQIMNPAAPFIFSWNPFQSFAWVSVGVPVMYSKYNQSISVKNHRNCCLPANSNLILRTAREA
jgi:hypothetical protein